jgi:uncharacterized protein
MHVVVSGGTGFIGTRLTSALVARGHGVTVLTRDASRSRDELHPKIAVVSWAPGASWEGVVDGADAIVNLAGTNLATRWTKAAKDRIVKSRLGALERLHAAVENAKTRPAVLASASAVGYYGPHGDEELTEEAAPGSGFLATTCVEWEAAARRFTDLGLRVVNPRIGVVLGAEGGALPKMLLPFKAGLGGPVGSGKQWMSWIHADDLVALVIDVLEKPAASGPVNATAPNPARNEDFSKTLGRVLHRPVLMKVPAPALKLLLGEMSSVLLEGQRVLPKRAQELGFQFRHTELDEALRDVLA